MKQETRFVTDGELIVIQAIAKGPKCALRARFFLDTGAEATTLIPELAAELGYSENDRILRSTVRTPAGDQKGYIVRLENFHALQISAPSFPVNVCSLEYENIHGLVGMNFLSGMNFEIRPEEKLILAERLRG